MTHDPGAPADAEAAGTGTGCGTGAGCGLRPRPAVDPVLAALIAQAAFELWPRPSAVDLAADAARLARTEEAERRWRQSGRWWAR